ncbi:MAG TPA: metallophosphoesterase [Terriglobia bacterium]
MKRAFLPSARGSRRVSVWTALLLALLLLSPVLLRAEPPAQPRVVAIGDVHCDFDAFASLLQHAGLIDAKLKWSGKDATLIQVGDILDRGKKCRTVMDLLMALEKEASKKRGRVVVMMGNHEMMNITGDLRYAEPMFATFIDKQSEPRRKKAWESYAGWLKSRAAALGKPEPVITPEMQTQWLTAHPPGYLEHREAMGPNGKYGKWLRERPAMVRLGNTLFVHGGISPDIGEMQPEAIAERIRSEVRAWDALTQFLIEQKIVLPFFDLQEMTTAVQEELAFRQKLIAEKQAEAAASGKPYQTSETDKKYIETLQSFLNYPGWFSIHPAGPLWFRGFAQWTDEEGEPQVTKLLAAYNASHFVVGHTPQKDGRIWKRFGGKVFLIDTGMLSTYYPGGRSSALEIAQNRFSAVYMDSKVVLLEPAAAVSSTPAAREESLEEIPGGGLAEQPGSQQQQTPPPPPHTTVQDAAVHSSSPSSAGHVWRGPDGNPLPFKSDEEILEFLRTAKIVSARTVGTGINQIRKAVLEKDGVRMNAAFRDHEEERDIAKMASGQLEMGFRDSYYFECAAYELAKLLGLDNVPPVVVRTYAGVKGSLQIWVESAMMETDRQKKKIRPPDPTRWNRQVQTLRLFDNLIYNTDRNMGNILIDPAWKLWMIDHTRAFRRHDELNNPNSIVQVERKLWEHLQSFNETEARQRLRPYLRGAEIDALFKRRLKIIAFVQKLVQEKGENEVFFTLN